MATLKDLRSWMERDLSRFGKLEDHIDEQDETRDPQIFDITWRFSIYTDNNRYSIVAIERKLGRSYLGCVSSSRKPRAGEDWHRGRDLADGPLSEDTWQRILADIVSYEMVRVNLRVPNSFYRGEPGALVDAGLPYPKAGEPTRLTTGDGPAPGTADVSRADRASSTRTRPGRLRPAGIDDEVR